MNSKRNVHMPKIKQKLFVAALVTLTMLTACGNTQQTFSNQSDLEQAEATEQASEQPEGEGESTPILLAQDYIEAQPINYLLYKKQPPSVKAIYVSSNRAGAGYIDSLIELINKTELNAMVIDVKTDDGAVTFKNGIAIADELELSNNNIPDIHELIKKLKENNIYTIARVVTFKDNATHEKLPDLYIKNKDGSVWRDGSKLKSGWLNPYNKATWDYVMEIATQTAQLGFDEIQFDYIRFDTAKSLNEADFGDTQGKSRVEIINEFAAYAVETLKPYGVYISADVYGTIINSDVDAKIVGQDYTALSRVLDYICPMVYPSHYANGSMGIEVPDLKPYETILKSMEISNERLSAIPEGEHRAVVRPWLQDFTATWLKEYIKYGEKERAEQIKAVYDAGLSEWLLWDAGVNYDAGGLEKGD